MRRARVVSAFILAAGLGLALLGQFYLVYRREYVWDGVFFWCTGLLLVGLAARRAGTAERAVTDQPRRPWWSGQASWPTLAMAIAIMVSAVAGFLARQRSAQTGYTPHLALWITSVVIYLLATVPPLGVRTGPARLSVPNRSRLWHLIPLGGLLVLALVVRIFDLEHVPRNFGGDEGTWAMEGLAMVAQGLANPFATGWFAFPSMSFLAWGTSMRVFGETVAGLRTLSAILGTAAVFTTFALARELWGRRVAWFSALALAVGHYHLHFSRLAVNNIADALLVTLALWLLLRGLRSGSTAYFAGAGAVMGLGWYGYFGSRLIGVIVVVYLAWRLVAEHEFLARHGQSLLVLAGGMLVVVAPLLLHYAQNPIVLVERSNQVNIFTSGWLAAEHAITGRSAAGLLLQQLWRSISAFNYTLDPTFWYRPAIPLLDFVSGGLFVLGLIWATAHLRRPANGLLLIWFWLAVLLGWVVTENPPSSQRLLIAAPALAMFVGLGLEWVIDFGRRAIGGPARLWSGSAAAVLIAVAVINLHHYFVAYTPTGMYGNPTAEATTVLGRYLMAQNDDSVVYFFGAPFVYWDFGTLRFLARDVDGANIPPLGEGEAVEVDRSRGLRFVFVPQRLEELESIQVLFPGGVESSAVSGSGDRLLYVLYEVPSPSG